MIEIGINQVVKNFGFKQVLSKASLTVMTGQRLALIGRNGSGKSTLLKLISGEEAPDSGEISIRRGAAVGMLEQIPRLRRPGKTVRQVLLEPFAPILAMERELRAMEARMSAPGGDSEALMGEYSTRQERYALAGGYDMEERTAKVIHGFTLSELLGMEYNLLSGGQKAVVELAAVMLRQPDILLLDEPTNHLDMQRLEWFEGFLSKYRGTVLMVSHDRWFLDRTATHTVLLEDGQCQAFTGGYTSAMEERERELMLEFEQYKNQQKQIEAMKAAIKRFREWGALNKNNPSFYRKAKMLEHRLEKMELLSRPQLEKPRLPLSFGGERTGHEVLTLKDFTLRFGELSLLMGADLTLYERDRLCLMGPNGSGKTSLLRAVMGGCPYSGEVKLNPGVSVGYIPQEIRFDPENASVLDTFRQGCPVDEGRARQILAKYYFTGQNVYKRAGSLSGGEKVLLKLAILVQRQINLLILDEPTNHIDIETREMLESALTEYQGTLLFISHDRYFIDRLATRLAEIKDRRIECFEGQYQEYRKL